MKLPVPTDQERWRSRIDDACSSFRKDTSHLDRKGTDGRDTGVDKAPPAERRSGACP